MNRRLHIRAEPELEIIDAAAWYEEQAAGLGDEFMVELDAVMERMARTPFQFPQIKHRVRRALLQRFPYSVYFLGSDHMVDVIAVVHQHRNSNSWERRSVP